MRNCFFLFLILIFSCTQNVEKPKNLVSEEKMVDILVEIYLHQQASYMNELGGKPLDYAKLNAYLLEEQGVKIEDFEKSYEYYVLNPDIYEPMLVEIRDQLEKRLPEEDRIKREKERLDAAKGVEN